MSANDWKEKGNTFLKSQNYREALNCYNQAVEIDPTDAVHFSNR